MKTNEKNNSMNFVGKQITQNSQIIKSIVHTIIINVTEMKESSKIDRNEITEYILIHNLSIKKTELEALTIGELVLMKVLLQMELEKNR